MLEIYAPTTFHCCRAGLLLHTQLQPYPMQWCTNKEWGAANQHLESPSTLLGVPCPAPLCYGAEQEFWLSSYPSLLIWLMMKGGRRFSPTDTACWLSSVGLQGQLQAALFNQLLLWDKNICWKHDVPNNSQFPYCVYLHPFCDFVLSKS